MVLLKTFCFCGRLETGGVILGWLGTAGSIILFISNAVAWSYENNPERVPVFASILAASAIDLISSILLIFGSIQKKSGLILPWLITKSVGCMGLILLTINRSEEGLVLLFSIASLGLSMYFWICILSLYLSLKNENAVDSCQQTRSISSHFKNKNTWQKFTNPDSPLIPVEVCHV